MSSHSIDVLSSEPGVDSVDEEEVGSLDGGEVGASVADALVRRAEGGGVGESVNVGDGVVGNWLDSSSKGEEVGG